LACDRGSEPIIKIYDREFKKDAYFALGVQQVWLVDRWSKRIEVWGSASSKKVARGTLAVIVEPRTPPQR